MSNLNEQNNSAMNEQKKFMIPEAVTLNIDSSDLAEDMEGLQLSFPRVKIPAGGTLLFELPGDNPDDPQYAPSLEGVILFNHPMNSYWPEDSEYSDDNPPLCHAPDGKIGHGEPGGVCASCGFNMFGSSGKGKACKNMRALYLIRSGEYLPLQISLPPTSIRPFGDFMKMAFMLRNRPIYSSIIKIGLKKASSNGHDYSVTTFSPVRDLTAEELTSMQAFAANFRDQAKKMLEEQAANMEQEAGAVEMREAPLNLPDNEGHFAGGVIDGEREKLPA